MKVERIICGMQKKDGKILSKYSNGILDVLHPKSRDKIKSLEAKDNETYLWFKTEQILTYSLIRNVSCSDPDQGGRTWPQNQTFLVNIHDFILYVKEGKNPFDAFKSLMQPEFDMFPEIREVLTV
jgi:hypothetical protein